MQKKGSSAILKGLNYKLRLGVYLMSILPLLVCIYLVANYILPLAGLKPEIVIYVVISVFIALFGFFTIKDIFDRIQSVSSEAKLIASGDVSRILQTKREDEVGELAESLNKLTEYIRSNMNELENYSEKTNKINLEIQKRVFLLSNLLQISSLVSQGTKLESIFKVIVEKARLMADSDIAYLLFRGEGEDAFSIKFSDGMSSRELTDVKVEAKEIISDNVARDNKAFVSDKNSAAAKGLIRVLGVRIKLKNTLATPIYLMGRVTAILGVGNDREQFVYTKEDMELLDIFTKQLTIAMENDLLIRRVEKLEIKDALTGLYNEGFIHGRLQEEIKRAIINRKPCAFVIFDVDNFQRFNRKFGSLKVEAALKKIASLLIDSVSEIDRVARIGDDAFAMVLPDKSKRQAYEVAELIREKIEFIFSQEDEPEKRLTISGGVSENPLDGIDAQELMDKAKDLLKSAKAQGRNRIAS